MANLIIKSSADNLVLQGSDASPAITVGATGTTTFAENATLSGTANALGTVTTGVLNSGVTGGSGLTTIVPVFYNAENVDQHMVASQGYVTSRNMESYSAYCSGVIPAQMTSVVDIQCYLQDGQVTSGTNQVLKWWWNMAGTGQGSQTHSLNDVSVGSWAQAENTNRTVSLMAANSSPNRFEELAAPSDAFGFRFNRTQGIALYFLGVLITYKIKE